MPFEIVRNDIVNMQVDAIVNTVSRSPVVGYGVDAGIHKKAGPELLKARERIGTIKVGDAVVTPGFGLEARYVIHTVSPAWLGGHMGEEAMLRGCYDRSLRLARENGCESVAFPLIAAGNHGFPKGRALQIAIEAFSSFLMEHEMHIYLVVFERAELELSEKLVRSVRSYIDEHYIREKLMDEYGLTEEKEFRGAELRRRVQILRQQMRERGQRQEELRSDSVCEYNVDAAAAPIAPSAAAPMCPAFSMGESLEDLLSRTDAGFSETLLRLIDRSGKKDSDIYKKANVDRKLFSKIRNNPNYKPSKSTALAFALALELSLEETRDFIGRAGFALTHSSKFDIIVEYYIKGGNYDVFELNEVLFSFDQPLIGA